MTQEHEQRQDEDGASDIWQFCPACGSGHKADMPDDNLVCSHPFHTADSSHQYGQMINREGSGADAGGEADPLVQEPND